VTVTALIPSYLYQEYNDDPDLQAFVDSFNSIAQEYLDWFNQVNLPAYTNYLISSSLLDWVAQGVYGLLRPSLPYGQTLSVGLLNTALLNTITLNSSAQPYAIYGAIGAFAIGVSPIEGYTTSGANDYVTSDDTFKRVITWQFFKGDGKFFNVRWLKRRVKRFLDGANGVDPGISETYDIRIVFGLGSLINIVLLGGTVTIPKAGLLNASLLNTITLNGGLPVYSNSRGRILKAAIESGVLELPFQYRYAVYG